MSDRRVLIKTFIRVACIITLNILLFRNEKIEVIFSAIAVTSIAVWALPGFLTHLIMIIFKINDDYGGTLMYDDTNPTDCKFRMVFNFEPEDLIFRDEFVIKVEKANLLSGENKD